MAKNCIIKLVSVMMELFIIILINVQANEVEKVLVRDEVLGPMELCLESKIEDCRHKRGESRDLEYQRCVMKGFVHCLRNVKEHEDPIIYRNCIKRCTHDCAQKKKGNALVSCLFGCYKDYIQKPLNVVNTHNP